MKIPRDIHGNDFADHLVRRWDFVLVRQVGSHLVLRTQVPTGLTVSVPAHRPLKTGTFAELLSEIAKHRGVTRDEILKGL